jgi:hypothetical protein
LGILSPVVSRQKSEASQSLKLYVALDIFKSISHPGRMERIPNGLRMSHSGGIGDAKAVFYDQPE